MEGLTLLIYVCVPALGALVFLNIVAMDLGRAHQELEARREEMELQRARERREQDEIERREAARHRRNLLLDSPFVSDRGDDGPEADTDDESPNES